MQHFRNRAFLGQVFGKENRNGVFRPVLSVFLPFRTCDIFVFVAESDMSYYGNNVVRFGDFFVVCCIIFVHLPVGVDGAHRGAVIFASHVEGFAVSLRYGLSGFVDIIFHVLDRRLIRRGDRCGLVCHKGVACHGFRISLARGGFKFRLRLFRSARAEPCEIA